MKISCKFYIEQPVSIIPLSIQGKVIKYELDGKNLHVMVQYFCEGKIYEIWLSEDDLAPIGMKKEWKLK
jgi:hypothetical protein